MVNYINGMNSGSPLFEVSALVQYLCYAYKRNTCIHIGQGKSNILSMSRRSIGKSHSAGWKNYHQLLAVITSHNAPAAVCCDIAGNAYITRNLQVILCNDITQKVGSSVNIEVPVYPQVPVDILVTVNCKVLGYPAKAI